MQQILEKWYLAYLAIQNNAEIMLKYGSTEVCARSMEEYADAEQILFTLEGEPLVDLFKEAEKDKGCMACWLSSSCSKHPECDFKIRRWFAYRKALVVYVGVMYFNDN
jgi:hypothetical protein